LANEKELSLRLHPCSRGLSDSAIAAIADAAHLMRCESGEVICTPDEPVTSVYLIVHGRLQLSCFDHQGRVVLQRFQPAGGQFGGLSATLTEPTPIQCVAEDPSVLLRFDFETFWALTRDHDAFRANFAALVTTSVKQVLFNEKAPVRPRLITFFHQSDETRIVSRAVLQRLTELGETCFVFTDRELGIAGVHEQQILQASDDLTPEQIREKTAEQLQSGRVVFDAHSSLDPERALRALVACEQIFWCVTLDNWKSSVDRLRRLEEHAPKWRDKVSIIWMLKAEETAPVATELRELAKCDFKICTLGSGDDPALAFDAGFARLIQFTRGIQIGVALGGGAARGMAHIGVLKALTNSGISINMIAGTSAGAMTGTLYASGLDPDFLVTRFVTDLRPGWFFRCLPHGTHWHLLYKYRRGHFDPMLRKYLGDRCIEQLPIPMHTITVDLVSGQAIVRESGDAVHGIVESINLPVLSKPINRQGEALIDGGLINNVPADVLTSKGCNFVIAVSVTAKMEREFASNRPDTPAEQMRPASTLQTLLRSYLVQSHSVNSIGVQPADYVIEPDVTKFDLAEFTRTDELSKIGESATEDSIPHIQKLLNRLDSKLYPIPS
jgi:predicted acylesterase/phospholipase RssA/CRP-like cAMP-binding protein